MDLKERFGTLTYQSIQGRADKVKAIDDVVNKFLYLGRINVVVRLGDEAFLDVSSLQNPGGGHHCKPLTGHQYAT